MTPSKLQALLKRVSERALAEGRCTPRGHSPSATFLLCSSTTNMIHHLAYRRGVLALSTICNECYSFRTRACLGASAYTSGTYLQGPDVGDCGQRISQYPQSPLSSSVRMEYVRDWEDVGPLFLEDVSLENLLCAGQPRNLGGRKLNPHPTILSGGTTLIISNQPPLHPLTLSRPPLPRPIVSSFSEPYALLHSMLLTKLQATPFDSLLTALAPAYSFNAEQVEENMSCLEDPHLDSVFAGYGGFEYVQLAHNVGSQSGNGNLRTCQRLFLFKGGAKRFREPAHAILRSVMLNRLAGLETVRMHVAQLRCRGLHVAPRFSLEGPESGAARQLERRVQNGKGAGKFRSRGQEKLKHDISILSRILKNRATWGARTVKLLKDSNLDVTPYHVCEVLRIHHSPIDRALKFFKWAKQQKKCKRGNFMYTKMIKILGDAEKFDEIWPLLEDMKKEHRLIQPSLFLGIIKSYIRVGQIEDAIVAFEAMESYGCRPNTLVFNSMLHLFIKAGEAERAEFLFRKMDRSFCAPDLYTYSLLIDSRGKAGQLDSAFYLFQEMHRRGCEPNVFTYSSLIRSLGKAGRFDEACNLLQGMKINGCAPNNVTYNGLISSLGMAGQADLGHHYYEEMLSLGFIPDLYTYAVVIANLVKVEKLSEAHKLFQIATAKTRFSDFDILKSVIGSLCKSGQCEAGLRFFEDVQRVGYNPSAAACNVLIHSLSKAGRVKKALDLFEEMSRRGASSDLVACNALSNGLIKEGSLMAAIKVVRFMTKQGINPDIFTYMNLVDLLCKADRFDDAYQVVFQEMVEKGCTPNAQVYNVLIDNLGKAGQIDEASKVFDRMNEQGCSPDQVTYNIVLGILGRVGKLDSAYQLFQQMKEKGFEATLFTYNVMIGNMVRAGRAEAGMKIFGEMVANQIVPNAVTLKVLLHANEESLGAYNEFVDLCKAVQEKDYSG